MRFIIALKLIFFTTLIFSNFLYIHADNHGNARGFGMSNASMVSSFGINAFGINPANFDYHKNFTLDKKDLKLNKKKNNLKPEWEISLMSVGGGYGSDTTIEFYNNYLKYLTINRESFTNLFTDFLSVLNFRTNVLPASTTQVNYDFELKWFSVNYLIPKLGAFNFTISDRAGLNTNAYSREEEMPSTFHYLNHGTSSYDLTNVQLNQSEAIAWWIRKYDIGFAKQFDFKSKSGIRSISFGISAGLVHGFGNVITYNSKLTLNTYNVHRDPNTGINHVDSITGKQDFNSQAALTDFFNDYHDGAQTHFTFFPKPAGKGYSVDLGFAMQIGSQWRIGASVTDLGKITWDYNTNVNKDTNAFAYYNFDLVKTDPTYNAFVNDLDGLDTRLTGITYTTEMPTKYRAGIMYQPLENLILEFNWQKGKNNLPGNSDENIFSTGTEFYPDKAVAFRTGFTVGGPGNFYIAFGTGLRLKHFTIDVAANGINQMFANKRFSVALSSKIIL